MGQRAGIGEKNRTDRLTHREDRAARKGGRRVGDDRHRLDTKPLPGGSMRMGERCVDYFSHIGVDGGCPGFCQLTLRTPKSKAETAATAIAESQSRTRLKRPDTRCPRTRSSA